MIPLVCRLHGNPLKDEGVGYIVDALLEAGDVSLQNLDLGDCGIEDGGAAHIARLLDKNQSVVELTLSGNSVGIEGWRKLATSLQSNSTLRTLSLDFNKIGDEEAAAIAEGIRLNRSLRSVDVESNRIGDEGGRKLLEAVRENTSIVDFTLMPMNKISQSIVDEVRDLLRGRFSSRPNSVAALNFGKTYPVQSDGESRGEEQHDAHSPNEGTPFDGAKQDEQPSEGHQEKDLSLAEMGLISEASSQEEKTDPVSNDSGNKDSAAIETEQASDDTVENESKPDGAQSAEVVGPEVAGPEVAGPEVAGPEVAGPEVARSEVAGPEVAVSEVAGPEVTGAEVAKPADKPDESAASYAKEEQEEPQTALPIETVQETEDKSLSEKQESNNVLPAKETVTVES